MPPKPTNKRKTEKPPAIDKLLKPAIGVVLAFVAYYFMKGLETEVCHVIYIIIIYNNNNCCYYYCLTFILYIL